MPFINLPPNLNQMFSDLKDRLSKLENAQRFTVPISATDPSNPRNGDMWINSTTNQLKAKDSTGTTRVITWT